MSVLCFGSLNIDYTYQVEHFVQKGETISSEGLKIFSGGKGLNQSVALAKAGVDVYHAGAVGTDGTFLIGILKAAGVHTDYVRVLEDVKSGHAIIQNDQTGDNCILLYGGANQSITRQQADDVLEHFGKGDYIVLQNEISEMPYIMQRAHEKEMIIVLNPSPMDEKIFALPLEYVNYFLLNEVEAAQLLGEAAIAQKAGWEQTAEKLRTRFPGAVIVLTLGSEGSVYMDAAETVRQPIYKVSAVDTTAAGDTFSGYFISGIIRGLSAAAAMDLAARASAIAVTRVGAAPSIPLFREVVQK